MLEETKDSEYQPKEVADRVAASLEPAVIVNIMSFVMRKPVLGVSNQVRHKLGCRATGFRLEIWD